MMRRLLLLPLLLAIAVGTLAETTVVARLENIEKKMFTLVNQERAERGLPVLKWNDKIARAAEGHLAHMVERKNLSHRFPGEPELSDRLAQAGVRFNASAENVAYATDWEDLHTGLMNSAGHRANILSPKYDAVGIAVALGPNGYYAVQNFAHTTSESGQKEAEARFAQGLRKVIRRNIEVVANASVRAAVCEMAERDRVEARRLPAEYPRQRMFAYTAFEPEEVPRSLLENEGLLNARKIEVGICYRSTEKYPGGVYWVGVIY
jgi:hypothetical protein